jgi:hypothetical protein
MTTLIKNLVTACIDPVHQDFVLYKTREHHFLATAVVVSFVTF